MTIQWWTVALQAINFLVLVWLLQRFLYKPVAAVIARRKLLVEKAFEEAEAAKSAADSKQQQFQEKETELAQSREALMKQTHETLEAERVRLLDAAREQAKSLLDGARAQIEIERGTALQETKNQVAEVAVEMASRLLQQIVEQPRAATALNGAFLAQMVARIRQLPGDEKATLERDVRESGSALEVATAVPLDADEQQRWSSALNAELPLQQPILFSVEPDLIGGAALRSSHAVLSLAWSEQLQQAKSGLLADAKADG